MVYADHALSELSAPSRSRATPKPARTNVPPAAANPFTGLSDSDRETSAIGSSVNVDYARVGLPRSTSLPLIAHGQAKRYKWRPAALFSEHC